MKKKEKNLTKVIPYYKKYWKLLILTIIFSFSYAGLSILAPILEGNLLTAFTTLDFNYILKMGLYLAILGIIIEIVTNIWSMIVLKLNSSCNFNSSIKCKFCNLLIFCEYIFRITFNN